MISDDFKKWLIKSMHIFIIITVSLMVTILFVSFKKYKSLSFTQQSKITENAINIRKYIQIEKAYDELIVDHEQTIRDMAYVASISPLRSIMTPDEISTLLKEVPTGNIFFTRFVFSASYGISIGYHGRPRTDHRGGDIHPEFPKNNKPMDMRVKPVADGVIETFGENDVYGKFIIVRYSERVRTFYGHLDKIFFAGTTGRKVNKDTVIGLMGNTGLVFSDNGGGGKHVHHEVQVWNGVDWVSIDPESFLINE